MAAINTSSLFDLWNKKEQRERRRITLTEISEVTGLSPETIRGIEQNRTTRLDASVLIALCKFFDVPPGPIPFIVYESDSDGEAQARKNAVTLPRIN